MLIVPNDIHTNCHECDLAVSLGPLEEGVKAACPRCGYVITRIHRNALDRMAIYSLTAICALFFSTLFPFVSLSASGQKHTLTLPQSITVLFERGDWLLGLITLLIVFILPLIFFISLNLLISGIRSQKESPLVAKYLKVIETFKFWNMSEIYFLGVLVSIIKVISLAEVAFGPAFWFFAIFSVAQIATLLYFDSYQIALSISALTKKKGMSTQRPGANALQVATAYLIVGIILYIPANIMPIMLVTTLGSTEPSTIIGGVVSLWEHGSYPIAIIIFVASVIVPLGKFLILIGLLLSEYFGFFNNPDTKIVAYRITEFVGRWSMVDVFVVAFLAALVQFGNMMSIHPGPAILAFAGMVIATMLSASNFEPKLFWDNNGPQ